MKTAFWKADWFLGLVIAIVLFGFARTAGFIPSVERWAYDVGVRMTSKAPSDRIAVIAIDEASLANIGRWPWSREVHAKLIDELQAAHAKVIAHTAFFTLAASRASASRTVEASSRMRPISATSAGGCGTCAAGVAAPMGATPAMPSAAGAGGHALR